MSETPPEPPPERELPAEPKQSRWSTIGVVLTSLISAVLVSILFVVITYTTPWTFFQSSPSAVPPNGGLTENAFQESIRSEPAAGLPMNEWRAVRSDHKAIAYTIAQCSKQDVDTLPRGWFSALLLDLHPNGDHYSSSNIPNNPSPESPGYLSSYARTVLFLSDAIGRARMQAARGADDNWPKMFWFSWLVVIISALGTLFVTLRTSLTDRGGWTVFLTVAAISLSTVGTVLTSAKTFYDPAKAYDRNERALLELQKLHQDVMLNFLLAWDPDKCDVGEKVRAKQQESLAHWVDELKEQHEGLVLAAVGDIPVTVRKLAEPIPQTAPSPDSTQRPGAAAPRTSAEPPPQR